MSDLEERLRNELGRRAEVEAASVTLAEVRERAVRLRRRARVGAVAGVAAAVLLVVLPVAVLATRSPDDAPPQPAPGGPTPSQIPTVGPTDLPSDRVTVREWVAGLPTGPAPQIEYQAGLTFVAPDGSERTSRYPNPLSSFVPYRGGVLGTDLPFGAQSHLVLDESLRRVDGGCTVGPPAVSGDGSTVFWTVGTCQEQVRNQLGSLYSASVGSAEAPVATQLLRSEGQGIRVLGPLGDGGPVAYVFADSGGSGPEYGLSTTDLAGSFQDVPGVDRGLDASPTGLIVGVSGRRVLVIDYGSADVLWRLLGRGRGDSAAFSPEGRYLLLDGAIHDASTGGLLGELDPVAALTEPVWEDGEHLLVGVGGSGGEAAVVRYDIDGDAEVAVDWRDATARGNPPSVGFEVLP